MKRLGLMIVVAAQVAVTHAAMAQTALKGAAKRADACVPIGRTEDGKLVYSMKCESIPKPVAPASPPQPAPAAEPEPESERSGLFGWSYDRRPKQ
ncbi:hypothetical protein ACQR16_14470 [Bradyrhizobium oligotrophicum]|uniref:hypothetical protein n=1 Tax=Bradyrhizobium oligotrophicum TaxID=44255 RepID=UPI003EBED387